MAVGVDDRKARHKTTLGQDGITFVISVFLEMGFEVSKGQTRLSLALWAACYQKLLSTGLSTLSGVRTGLLSQGKTGLGMGSERQNKLTGLGTFFLQISLLLMGR